MDDYKDVDKLELEHYKRVLKKHGIDEPFELVVAESVAPISPSQAAKSASKILREKVICQ